MFLRKALLSTVGLLFVFYSHAFVVEDVRVLGLQRITAGTFFNYLPVSKGDNVEESDYPHIIRELYKTEFFDDVVIERDGDVLIVRVTERPIIGEVNIEGNSELTTSNITEGLASIGVSEGNSFDKLRANVIEQELLNLYYARSKYDVIVNIVDVPLGDNRVAVNINIEEGISARIKQINIVGNKAFSESRLLKEMQSTTPNLFSLITKSDQYSGERLRADIESLEAFYLNRGFLDFRVESSQVSLTSDKKSVYITINVSEGEPYRVDAYTFTGSDLVSTEELEKQVTFSVGDYYSRAEVKTTQDNLQAAYADLGYAFTDIQVLPNINSEQHIVGITFVASPGKKTYVRRILFKGNYKTNDEVLRREMRQMEAAVYDRSKVVRSEERVRRLGHITNVIKSEVPVEGSPEQIDIVYEVVEEPTRNITASVGYGTTSGVILSAGYETANFLGTGNMFNIDFSTSDTEKSYSMKFTDPYWTVDGISRTFRLYYEEEDEDESNISDWTRDTWGGALSFGFPINEYESFFSGVEYRGIEINEGNEVPWEISEYLDEKGDTFDELVLNFNWTHDTRDKTIFASEGSITRLGSEIITPGSDEKYYKLSARNRTYIPFNEELVFALRGDVSYGDGYGSTDGLPFYANYYAGGLSTVRGYKTNTLGPTYTNGDRAGGSLRTTFGAEVILPWNLGVDEDNIRVAGFIDGGNVFADSGDFDTGDFRYSAGIYVLWRSPVGPINLSYAVPLNDEDDDDLEQFQFTFGVPF